MMNLRFSWLSKRRGNPISLVGPKEKKERKAWDADARYPGSAAWIKAQSELVSSLKQEAILDDGILHTRISAMCSSAVNAQWPAANLGDSPDHVIGNIEQADEELTQLDSFANNWYTKNQPKMVCTRFEEAPVLSGTFTPKDPRGNFQKKVRTHDPNIIQT